MDTKLILLVVDTAGRRRPCLQKGNIVLNDVQHHDRLENRVDIKA